MVRREGEHKAVKGVLWGSFSGLEVLVWGRILEMATRKGEVGWNA